MGLLRNIEQLIEDLGKFIIDVTATMLQWVVVGLILVLLIFLVVLYRNRS